MISTVKYMCGSVLSLYMGTGNDKDEKFFQTINVNENRTAKITQWIHIKNLYALCSIRNESNSRKFCGVLPKIPRTNLIFCVEKERLLPKKIKGKRGNRDNNIVESQNVSY